MYTLFLSSCIDKHVKPYSHIASQPAIWLNMALTKTKITIDTCCGLMNMYLTTACIGMAGTCMYSELALRCILMSLCSTCKHMSACIC